jgi:hypothetical protein
MVFNSDLITGLLTMQALVLAVLVSCWPSFSSSCKQFMFLWPGAKPYSMFLASF